MPEQVLIHLPHLIHLLLSTSKCVLSSNPITLINSLLPLSAVL
jgi:hypothetical protein